ncbi:MAG TPA: hypothetical protein VJK03_04935 [Candidatus Nanoarchaeia archaeon]|nr:hypothetical protein [Candidatus Nanoarchaeia archaeon]
MTVKLSLLLEPTTLSSFAFLIATAILIYFAARKTRRDYIIFTAITTAILLIWFFTVFILSQMRFFAQNPLFAPNIFIGFLVLFELLRRVYAAKSIRKLAEAFSQHWLIGIQTYRIVGVGFLFLWARGMLPAAFAFPSGIGDIIVGVSAPLVAWAYYKQKPYARNLAITWNILGILDLIIALSVGFLGFPRPVQFAPLAPTTEALSLFPLAIIPLFAVPLAILMHSLSLRVLRKKD